MTADQALSHQYMVNHLARVERQEFQREYVMDWLDLKQNVLTKGKTTMRPPMSVMDQRQESERAHPVNGDDGGSMTKNEFKRKAFLMGASPSSGIGGGIGRVEDQDDLYNLDDLLH